jgi:hypothetical protein
VKDFALHSVWHMHDRPGADDDWLVFVIVSVKDESLWCKVIAAANESACPFGHAFTFTSQYKFADYCERLA